MRHKIEIVAFIVILVAVIGCGLYCKSSYKDFNGDENVWDNFIVARLEEELVDMQIERMDTMLGDSKIIIAAQCEDTFHYRFRCTTQKIKVVSVFKGEELKEGDEVEIVRSNNYLYFDTDTKSNISLGYVNEMKPGKTYLIFLDRKLENTAEDDPIYIQSEEFVLAPIFCYENIVNKIPEKNEGNMTYTDYDAVKDNEFFVRSKETDEKLQALKAKLLKEYDY